MRISFYCICFSLIWIGKLVAQEDFRQQAPQAGPAPKLEMGTYDHFKLDNGLTVIVVENNKIPTVDLKLFLDYPPVSEGDSVGMAQLTGELLSKGTTSRTKAQIDEEIDYIGATLTSSEDGLTGATLSKHLGAYLTVFADIALNPSFPEKEFNKLKTQAQSFLVQSREDPKIIADEVAKVIRYGADHPYGEIPTQSSLQQISLDACKSFYSNYFVPNIGYLVFVGAINSTEAKKLAEKYFGAWEKKAISPATFELPELPESQQIHFVEKEGAVQSVIALSFPLEYKPGGKDAIKAYVMNTILGGAGNFGSRLNANLREDKGYTYGVRSQLVSDKSVGYFSVVSSVRNEVTIAAIQEMLSEMELLQTQRVPPKELKRVKQIITGNFARSFERPQMLAQLALNTIRYDLPKDYYANYLSLIDSVSSADIMDMAEKYLKPAQAHILVVGNKQSSFEALEKLATPAKVNSYTSDGQLIELIEMEALDTSLSAAYIIEQYLDTIGGVEKLALVEDLTTRFSTTAMNMEVDMIIRQKVPNKLLFEVKAGDLLLQEQRFDGTTAVNTTMGTKSTLDGPALDALKERAQLFGEQFYLQEAYQLELLGIEIIDGQKAYKIKIIAPSGQEKLEYYAEDSFLKIREVLRQADGDQIITLINDYSDYREVEGVLVPFALKTAGATPVPLELKASSIEMNTQMEDAIFQIE